MSPLWRMCRACVWLGRECVGCSLQRFPSFRWLRLRLLSRSGGVIQAADRRLGAVRFVRRTGRHAAQRDCLRDRQQLEVDRHGHARALSQDRSGLSVIGALAYRGCSDCVADVAVPPKVTPATPDEAIPALLTVKNIALKPREQITLLLSVAVSREGRVTRSPPPHRCPHGLRCALCRDAAGPRLCAGKNC